MKITIDDKVCLKHKMTPCEVLIALAVRAEKLEDNLENMLQREILVNHGNYQVTQRWSDVVDEILADSGCAQDDDRLKNLAKKMREHYPLGRIIDKRTGKPTSFIFRCNPKEIELKLKTFFLRYGNYSDEDILDAERRYVASWNGNYQQPGFRQLKYFIWKDVKKEGPDSGYVESSSPLLDFLENKESDEEIINDEDWTTKLV